MYILWSYWSILFWACNFARYEGFSISSLYHGKNYFDWKQATFSDCFFITVSSSACNFAENRPRVGRKRAYTVKIFNEVIRYCCFFFSKLYLTHKHENFDSKIFPLAIIDVYGVCMDSQYFQTDSRIATCGQAVNSNIVSKNRDIQNYENHMAM